ncbi:hypothetical protein EYF80_013237 [Liparis tanakae]|uniref:Uncharacterized protein n=1 Tax=Liparis tanakae TaxID=230148 RepID=A0A4Z2IFH3_9TELE|nr:hypothetical protein EYF80_013237 [Liparis tanakae]
MVAAETRAGQGVHIPDRFEKCAWGQQMSSPPSAAIADVVFNKTLNRSPLQRSGSTANDSSGALGSNQPTTDRPDPASPAFDLQLEFWWEEKAAGASCVSKHGQQEQETDLAAAGALWTRTLQGVHHVSCYMRPPAALQLSLSSCCLVLPTIYLTTADMRLAASGCLTLNLLESGELSIRLAMRITIRTVTKATPGMVLNAGLDRPVGKVARSDTAVSFTGPLPRAVDSVLALPSSHCVEEEGPSPFIAIQHIRFLHAMFSDKSVLEMSMYQNETAGYKQLVSHLPQLTARYMPCSIWDGIRQPDV